MSFLLPGLRRGLLISTPFILSTPLLVRQFNRPILCDSPNVFQNTASGSRYSSTQETQSPIIKQSGFMKNPKTVRQISLGSILGVLGGLGVSVFSKPLALLIGLGVIIVQILETRGIHIVPYSYLQKRFKQTDVRKFMRNNVPLKFSFGITFFLAAFTQF